MEICVERNQQQARCCVASHFCRFMIVCFTIQTHKLSIVTLSGSSSTNPPDGDAVSPKGGGKKRAWTKNKLEELRRRSPGHDSAAHHAKPGPNSNMGNEKEKRRLVTFIGGLDMCDGRYDTPRHSLFHTLATVHTEDFHQACITGADIKKGGQLPNMAHMKHDVNMPRSCHEDV